MLLKINSRERDTAEALGGGSFANQAIVGAIVSLPTGFPTGFGNSVVGTGKI